MTEPRRIIIIAGPNGAGKTTFAREFLPQEAHCPDFINADLIAAGLSPFNPEAAALRAGRVMLKRSPRAWLRGAASRSRPRSVVGPTRGRFRHGERRATT
jgi:predicted ABC-type ATPase